MYDITYSDGSILVDGISHCHSSKYVCSLDAEGRIVEVERTDVIENETLVRHSSYTYDADGHLVNDYHISDPEGEGASSVYIWEGDELREIRTAEGSMVVLFETSNAPAEDCFEVFSFSSTLTFLWMQGFYGRAPAHLPSKKTVQYFISGIPILNVPMEYKATLDGNGHLATLEHICEAHGEDDKYVLIWEEK